MIKDSIAHVNYILRVISLPNPIDTTYGTHKLKRIVHIVNYSFFTYCKAFSITSNKLNIN